MPDDAGQFVESEKGKLPSRLARLPVCQSVQLLPSSIVFLVAVSLYIFVIRGR